MKSFSIKFKIVAECRSTSEDSKRVIRFYWVPEHSNIIGKRWARWLSIYKVEREFYRNHAVKIWHNKARSNVFRLIWQVTSGSLLVTFAEDLWFHSDERHRAFKKLRWILTDFCKLLEKLQENSRLLASFVLQFSWWEVNLRVNFNSKSLSVNPR